MANSAGNWRMVPSSRRQLRYDTNTIHMVTHSGPPRTAFPNTPLLDWPDAAGAASAMPRTVTDFCETPASLAKRRQRLLVAPIAAKVGNLRALPGAGFICVILEA